MYLEIYESIGKTGEVHLSPYSYEYDGIEDEIEEYLSQGPFTFVAVESDDDSASPIDTEETDPENILMQIGDRVLTRRALSVKIVYE